MTSVRKVAVVTGGNKGIGFAIVRGLCKQFDGDVILAARNIDLGKAAVSELEKEGLKPKFHQMDISDKKSIERFKSFLVENYGSLDILVNNAGMAYKIASMAPFAEQAEETMKVNFTGTLDVCRNLFPLLRNHARVVQLSSIVSQWAVNKCGDELKKVFISPDITIEKLEGLMAEFVECAKNGTTEEKGWCKLSYGVSKIGVTVMTVIQQRAFDNKKDIIVNCCCPGFVNTDMTSHKGIKTADEGADTPLYLALLPANVKSPRGEYVSDRIIRNWSDSQPLKL